MSFLRFRSACTWFARLSMLFLATSCMTMKMKTSQVLSIESGPSPGEVYIWTQVENSVGGAPKAVLLRCQIMTVQTSQVTRCLPVLTSKEIHTAAFSQQPVSFTSRGVPQPPSESPSMGSVTNTLASVYRLLGRTVDPASRLWEADLELVRYQLESGKKPSEVLAMVRSGLEKLGEGHSLAEYLAEGSE
jgi:hypothetical protein